MQMLIWAFGSMLVLMLIFSFLPLGFTFKGKYLITFIGFLLALCGIAANTIFQLWQTALLLTALIFFVSYIMDSRIRSILYKEEHSVVNDLNDKDLGRKTHFEQVKNEDSLDFFKGEILSSPLLKENDLKGLESLIPEYINVDLDNGNQSEDISFLLKLKSKSDVYEQKEERKFEISNLSEIESLLDEEINSKNKTMNMDWREDIDVVSRVDEAEKSYDDIDTNELAPLADPVFDFLFATREAAAGQDGVQDEQKKKLTLQK
jgi:hypothetical protein